MTPLETRVMDLWDGGMSRPRIAKKLGVAVKDVNKIVTCYHEGNDTKRYVAALVKGSAELAAAIDNARSAGSECRA